MHGPASPLTQNPVIAGHVAVAIAYFFINTVISHTIVIKDFHFFPTLYNVIHSRHSIDTPHTVWSAIDSTVDWARRRRKSIASTLKKHATNSNTIYTVKIVNKRPRNLLNEIQNVFIDGKQVKIAKIMQMI